MFLSLVRKHQNKSANKGKYMEIKEEVSELQLKIEAKQIEVDEALKKVGKYAALAPLNHLTPPIPTEAYEEFRQLRKLEDELQTLMLERCNTQIKT
jgi:hypothetical protein